MPSDLAKTNRESGWEWNTDVDKSCCTPEEARLLRWREPEREKQYSNMIIFHNGINKETLYDSKFKVFT